MRSPRPVSIAALLLVWIPALHAQAKRPVTVEALEEVRRLESSGRGNPLAWSPDGERFLYRQGGSLRIFTAATQASEELIDTQPLDDAALTAPVPEDAPFDWQNRRVSESPVQWAANGTVLYASGGDLFTINSTNGDWLQITHSATAERDPKLSPDGSTVAFLRDWDLYAMELASGEERRLTNGGSDLLRNGAPDWVYPEELDLGTAYWWSPDSDALAYLQFDLSSEPVTPHADLTGTRALYEPQRYPHPGDDNPSVRLGIVNVPGPKSNAEPVTRWLDLGDTRTHYLAARVTWAPDGQSIYVVRSNRIQNEVQLLRFQAARDASATAVQVLAESDPYWVNLSDEPVFLGDGRFLWLSERTGFRHVYLYESNGRLIRQVTEGDWEVASLEAVIEGPDTLYFTSSEPSPLERHLYSIGLNGSGKKRLTREPGTHSVGFGGGGKYYLRTFSSDTQPPAVTLHRVSSGEEIAVYRNADTRIADQYDLLTSEFLTFAGPDGTLLHARLIRPPDFDASQKYPAIVSAYGGPGAQRVRNAWTGADLDQAFAHAGFVVWLVDNRGSTGYGHAFEAPVFRNLGEVELADQIAGVEYLVSMGFVDPDRIGIRGWSYGGFMTLNALLNAPEVFRAGAAGAPVTDWRNYDTIYTERYMGLPENNRAGYTKSSLPRLAEKLQGKLMLLHNIEDDNVLFQNTVQMIAALEQAGKQFDLVLYTQKTHGVGGVETQHMNTAMVEFFRRHLAPE